MTGSAIVSEQNQYAEIPPHYIVERTSVSQAGRLVGRYRVALKVAILLTYNSAGIHITVALKHGDDEYLGFLCQDVDLDSVTHLRRLVELNLGDDTLMQRELQALVV